MEPVPSRRAALVLAAVLAAAPALAACQPVDDVVTRTGETPPSAAASPLGAPVQGMPADLAELLARTAPVARAWQDEPRVAEIRVRFAGRERWSEAEVTYLAADADRLLTVTVAEEGLSRELSTLATLNLRPVSARGLSALPELPAEVREPAALARAARVALRRCDVGSAADGVLYATGAPVSWNGRRWTVPPVWTATVIAAGGAVQLHLVTGERLGCIDAE